MREFAVVTLKVNSFKCRCSFYPPLQLKILFSAFRRSRINSSLQQDLFLTPSSFFLSGLSRMAITRHHSSMSPIMNGLSTPRSESPAVMMTVDSPGRQPPASPRVNSCKNCKFSFRSNIEGAVFCSKGENYLPCCFLPN